MPVEKKVEGSNVILAKALQGYALNEFPEGTDSDATHLPWVDNYIQHFIDVIAPMYDVTTAQASLSLTTLPLHEPDPGKIAVDQRNMDSETPFPFVRA